MEAYRLLETKDFEKQFKKLPKEIQKRFVRQFKSLQQDPYSIGKPLSFEWFRELKNEGYRVYYLVYDNEIIVLFVGVSNKNAQQEMIGFIKDNLKSFKDATEK